MDTSGTVVDDVCEPGGSPIPLSWNVLLPSRRGRVLLWTCLGRSIIDDVTSRRLVFLTCWNIVLSSHLG